MALVKMMMKICLHYYNDSRMPYVVTGKRKKGARDVPEILDEVAEWVLQGCPAGPSPLVVTQESSPPLTRTAAVAITACGGDGLDVKKSVSKEIPSEARGGRWPFWLEDLALSGLRPEVNAGMALHEFAKWYWHIQYYDEPDKETRIAGELEQWIFAKHNRLCRRIEDGNFEDIRRQIRDCIRLASEISDPASLYGFCKTRQKRSERQYPRIINIDLLAGEAAAQPPSTFSHLLTCSNYKGVVIETPLPPQIMTQIVRYIKAQNRHKLKGEYTIVKVARRALNLIWHNKGSASIQESVWQEICETKHRRTILTHKNDLVAMGFLKPEWHKAIVRGKSCSRYTMTKGCKRLFANYYREQQTEATG